MGLPVFAFTYHQLLLFATYIVLENVALLDNKSHFTIELNKSTDKYT